VTLLIYELLMMNFRLVLCLHPKLIKYGRQKGIVPSVRSQISKHDGLEERSICRPEYFCHGLSSPVQFMLVQSRLRCVQCPNFVFHDLACKPLVSALLIYLVPADFAPTETISIQGELVRDQTFNKGGVLQCLSWGERFLISCRCVFD
jgi:hypothetical protein